MALSLIQEGMNSLIQEGMNYCSTFDPGRHELLLNIRNNHGSISS